MDTTKYLRRKAAGEYLKATYGFGSNNSLAKLAVVGGGPAMHYAGDMPLYTVEDLDAWARSKISTVKYANTSARGANREAAA